MAHAMMFVSLFLVSLLQADPPPAASAPQEPAHVVDAAQVKAWLEEWQAGSFAPEVEDIAFARLRGYLGAAEATRIAAMLEDPAVPRRGELLELLLQVPFEASREVLLAYALDESRPAQERGRLAEFLLLIDGPDAFRDLAPSFHPEAQPPYLRRFFAGWRESIGPSDLATLENFVLASPSESAVGQYALQLWARHETDPEARRRIYLHARDASTSYRSAAVEALGRRGPDPQIAAMLLEELNGASPELRRLARRMLPSFDSPEALLEAYREKAKGQSVNLRGRWMGEIAALPLPEAKREAMVWLVDGGWSKGSLTNQVVTLLGRSKEVDPLLPTLLNHGEIPERVLLPLALARAQYSEDAHAYLLDLFPHASSVLQIQILRAIALRGSDKDLRFVREVFESNAYAAAARAAAAEILVLVPAAEEYVRNRFDRPLSGNYELDAAWLRSLAAHPRLEWRDEAVAAATIAGGYEDVDERRGLRMEVWSALGRTGKPAHVEILAARLWHLLREPEAQLSDEEVWETLAGLRVEFPELSVVLTALANCPDRRRPVALDLPEDLLLEDIATDPLLIAATILAKTYPYTAVQWLEELRERKLQLLDHLRVLALSAHHLPSVDAKRGALRALLEHPETLTTYRRLLLEPFQAEGSGWVMVVERLEERLLLEDVIAEIRPLADLHHLLDGYADDPILRRAADYAELAGDLDLALALAKRRTDHLPLSDSAHAHYALLLGDLQRPEDAMKEWAIVERVAPDRSRLWNQARAALGRESE